MILLSLILIGNYAVKGPFWALATDWLSASTAAAGIAAINTLSHIGTSGATALLGIIKDSTGSVPMALATHCDRKHRGSCHQSGAAAISGRP
jgi:hypothetical protein